MVNALDESTATTLRARGGVRLMTGAISLNESLQIELLSERADMVTKGYA
jgi:hypothetical protein